MQACARPHGHWIEPHERPGASPRCGFPSQDTSSAAMPVAMVARPRDVPSELALLHRELARASPRVKGPGRPGMRERCDHPRRRPGWTLERSRARSLPPSGSRLRAREARATTGVPDGQSQERVHPAPPRRPDPATSLRAALTRGSGEPASTNGAGPPLVRMELARAMVAGLLRSGRARSFGLVLHAWEDAPRGPALGQSLLSFAMAFGRQPHFAR
jgi:hypothetical protein